MSATSATWANDSRDGTRAAGRDALDRAQLLRVVLEHLEDAIAEQGHRLGRPHPAEMFGVRGQEGDHAAAVEPRRPARPCWRAPASRTVRARSRRPRSRTTACRSTRSAGGRARARATDRACWIEKTAKPRSSRKWTATSVPRTSAWAPATNAGRLVATGLAHAHRSRCPLPGWAAPSDLSSDPAQLRWPPPVPRWPYEHPRVGGAHPDARRVRAMTTP